MKILMITLPMIIFRVFFTTLPNKIKNVIKHRTESDTKKVSFINSRQDYEVVILFVYGKLCRLRKYSDYPVHEYQIKKKEKTFYIRKITRNPPRLHTISHKFNRSSDLVLYPLLGQYWFTGHFYLGFVRWRYFEIRGNSEIFQVLLFYWLELAFSIKFLTVELYNFFT